MNVKLKTKMNSDQRFVQSLENLENRENGFLLERVRENLEKSRNLKWDLFGPGKSDGNFVTFLNRLMNSFM